MECKNNRSLPFDFYLPEYNTCIEYDGEQHFYPIDFSFGKLSHENVLEKFIDVKKNDSIKTNFCKKEGINLLRISYKQNIKKELEKWYKEKISN